MPTPAYYSRVPPTTYLAPPSKVEDDLPIDPRVWSRAAVWRWVSRRGGDGARFPCNGKALCLMSRDMFERREPGRGARMYEDFRRRLSRALALQDLMEKLQMAAK